MEELKQELQQQLDRIEKLVLMGQKDTLDVAEVAQYASLSKDYVYQLVHQRKIPHYKNSGGKLLYFDKAEIDRWLKAHRVATTEETEQAAAIYAVRRPIGRPRGTTKGKTAAAEKGAEV